MFEIDRIQRHLGNQEHWRAKELLQGRLGVKEYQADIYEAYGYVLLQMHDTLEAGKYLFLSGVRRPEYTEAISLYLDRHRKGGISNFYHTFPKSAQGAKFDSYPPTVKKELSEMGYSEDIVKARISDACRKSTLTDTLIGWLFLLIFLALFVGFLVSGARGLKWLFS